MLSGSLSYPYKYASFNGCLKSQVKLSRDHQTPDLLLSLILSAQEVAVRMLRSTEDVCRDQGELPNRKGPVVRWRVLPLAHSQQ